MRKDLIIAVVLIIPLIIFATPQFNIGGSIPIWKNISLLVGTQYAGISYQSNLVYKITKTVEMPFIGKKEIVIPVKFGKNTFNVYYDGEFNVSDLLQLNVYDIIKSTSFTKINSRLNFAMVSLESYKNYRLSFSTLNCIASFGIPVGLSLKISPLLIGVSFQSDNILFSINTKGLDFILVSDNLKIFIDTLNDKVSFDLSFPLNGE